MRPAGKAITWPSLVGVSSGTGMATIDRRTMLDVRGRLTLTTGLDENEALPTSSILARCAPCEIHITLHKFDGQPDIQTCTAFLAR
jgi:hypothetical protein